MLEILIENRAKAEKERLFREKEKREAEKRVFNLNRKQRLMSFGRFAIIKSKPKRRYKKNRPRLSGMNTLQCYSDRKMNGLRNARFKMPNRYLF